jgi:hypothetical protein
MGVQTEHETSGAAGAAMAGLMKSATHDPAALWIVTIPLSIRIGIRVT